MDQPGGTAGGGAGEAIRVHVSMVRLCRGGQRDYLLLLSPDAQAEAGAICACRLMQSASGLVWAAGWDKEVRPRELYSKWRVR